MVLPCLLSWSCLLSLSPAFVIVVFAVLVLSLSLVFVSCLCLLSLSLVFVSCLCLLSLSLVIGCICLTSHGSAFYVLFIVLKMDRLLYYKNEAEKEKVLCCLVLCCVVLCCLVLSCLVLCCLVLSCLVLCWLGLAWLGLAWLGFCCLLCRVVSSRLVSCRVLSCLHMLFNCVTLCFFNRRNNLDL